MSNRILVMTAGETLTDKEGAPAKITAGYAYMCDAVTDACIGVISKGAASGSEVEITYFGDAFVRTAESVSRGEHITIASGGETCNGGLASGSVCLGLFTGAGAAGDLAPAFIVAPARYEEG